MIAEQGPEPVEAALRARDVVALTGAATAVLSAILYNVATKNRATG
jgi:hypothetical protein